MWFSLSAQTAYFLWSIALGAAASVLYDLVRAVRVFFKAGKLTVLFCDVLFFVLCGVLTSLFALPFNKGGVRAFIVFGEAVGFLCCHVTLGRAAGRFYSILSKGIASVCKKICDLLKIFFDYLLKIASRVVYNISVVIDRLRKYASDRRKNRRIRKQNCRGVRKNSPYLEASGNMRRTGRQQRKRIRNEKKYQKRYSQKEKECRHRGRARRGG